MWLFFDLRQYFLISIILILYSWLNKKGLKMENIYLNNPDTDDIFDGPTDEELETYVNTVMFYW